MSVRVRFTGQGLSSSRQFRRTAATGISLILTVGALAACGGGHSAASGKGSTLTVAVDTLGAMNWAPTKSGEDTEKAAQGM
jgi:hypothetical protein